VLFAELYDGDFARDQVEVLPHLLEVDAAHVVMLAEVGILARGTAAALLRVNRELAAKAATGERVLAEPDSHRGLYMVYEGQLIAQLGPEVGGAAHVARSRNDLNATMTRLRARDELLALTEETLDLLAALAAAGRSHAATLLAAFTHLQPAQPSTFGHYLAGVASEVLETAERLSAAYPSVNRSPLGAGAGLGTSFPIDPQRTAALLGFDAPVANSLAAVASRGFAVEVLAAAAQLATTLTRLALDLQLWSSHAYGFFSLPDDLVSTSSMMPQKRNAFVFETVRGQAARVVAGLTGLLYGLKSTPFSNSVEVSGEAASHLWPALTAARKSCRLSALLVRHLVAVPERMESFLAGAGATMTALADHLVARHGLAFRQAHDAVGELLRRRPELASGDAGAIAPLLSEIASAHAERPVTLGVEDVASVLDPTRIVRAACFGGGPAPESVARQLDALALAQGRLVAELASRRKDLTAAGALRQKTVRALADSL
jgi:argininosuccinate lyase